MDELHLKTKDHPEAGGRQAQYGDLAWTVRMPLEDQMRLAVIVKCNAREQLDKLDARVASLKDQRRRVKQEYEAAVDELTRLAIEKSKSPK